MKRNCRWIAACALTLAVAAHGQAETPSTNELLAKLPATANTVVVINVKAIREQSGNGHRSQIIAGSVVPASVDLVALATHLETGKLESRRSMGVIQLNKSVTIDDLVDNPGGTKVDLGGETAVLHPRKGYYVLLAPNLVGFGRNVNRQELARGIKFARTNKTVVLASNLTAALAAAGDAPIEGVLDMENMLESHLVAARLSQSELMAGRDKAEIESIAALIASIKTVSLTVRGKELDQAEVKLEFGKPVDGRGELVKSVFLEVLEDIGASLSDINKSKVVAVAQSVTLKMDLSDEGLIRVMSIFMPPSPEALASRAAGPKLESNGVSIENTKRYLQPINLWIDDLRRRYKNATDYSRVAAWHDSIATQIEDLPFKYVDADVAKFAEMTAKRLRVISYSLRGVVVEVSGLEKGTTYVAVGAGSLWGGADINTTTNLAEIRTQQAEIIRKDAARRLELWESIDSDQRKLVKTLRERYKINFE
ncbi:MAG: hypothetical protein ACJ8F7_21525 [Gemmataceae bacterium]